MRGFRCIGTFRRAPWGPPLKEVQQTEAQL